MLLRYFEFIRESQEEEKPKSKRQLRNEEWHRKNPNPVGTILTIDKLDQFGIPDNIIEMMKEWQVIYKSPYSKSFYSSSDISWSNKPKDSYRVSDHWNFFTRGTYHCRTDKKVPDNTHYAIGKWNAEEKLYNIILIEPTKIQFAKKEAQLKKLLSFQKFKDPEVIEKKKMFKDKVDKFEVLVNLNYKGREVSGILYKYNGNKIKILRKDFNPKTDISSQIIYSNDDLKIDKIIIFTDIDGNNLEDPYVL